RRLRSTLFPYTTLFRSIGPVDGSIVPCATGGSLGFLFDDSIRVLRNLRGPYREKVWTKYSFRDAFNPLTNWYDGDVLGIDLGIRSEEHTSELQSRSDLV